MTEGLGKSWSEMSAEERAIFTTHLMYEPMRERLTPEPQKMTDAEFAAEMKSLKAREQWIADAEEWLERQAIQKAADREEKNRTDWTKRP